MKSANGVDLLLLREQQVMWLVAPPSWVLGVLLRLEALHPDGVLAVDRSAESLHHPKLLISLEIGLGNSPQEIVKKFNR